MASKERRQATRTSPKSVRVYFATGPCDATEEQIRRQAFEVYEKRRDAGVAGDPVSDWLRAESELNQVAHPSEINRRVPQRADA